MGTINKDLENIGKWIIDTDPGVDDSFAIILALTALGENLIALSIENGNVGVEKCFLNAKKICVIKNIHIPIYKGVKLNLSGINLNASLVHGKDGLYELEEYNDHGTRYNEDVLKNLENKENEFIDKCSPLKLIELSHKIKGGLNILAIGPLTNIAVAFMLDSTLPERINKLVIMGGSYTSLGNIKTNVEFNFACDPVSAKIVLDNFNKENNKIVIYPWETCNKHLLLREHLDSIKDYTSETKAYCSRVLIKKEGTAENGVFADYGSAVYMCNNSSVEESIFRYIDISIDSDISTFGQMCVEHDYHHVDNKKLKKMKKKVEIILELNKSIFYDLFSKMNCS